MGGKINLEEARKTMVLDVNARYFGLEALGLMENAGRGIVEEISQRQVFLNQA
jgi:NAD(P)H-hydrate repair Nnr-like enzyme with NAD(P)H-hydrate epimerase domain